MKVLPESFGRRPPGGSGRQVVRAAAWLLLGLLAAAPGLLSPALARGAEGPSAKQSAEGIADTLRRKLKDGTMVVLPLTGGHTGLPDSVAKRLETLIVGSLDSAIAEEKDVELITGDDVHRIYRQLEESSFDGDSEKLLKAVLRAARANSVLACELTGADPDSFEIRCSTTYAEFACSDGTKDLDSCAEAVKVKKLHSLKLAQADFPWRNPDEYLRYVFTGLAWKIVRMAGLHPRDAVVVEPEDAGTGSKTALGKYVTRSLRREMAAAKQRSLGWRGAAGDGRRYRLKWYIGPWGDDRYELSAELYEEVAGDLDYETGERAYIVISALPRNVRLEVGPPRPPPPPDTVAADDSPPPPPSECGSDETAREIPLPDQPGLTLGDWVYQADKRLKQGDYEALFREAKRYVRELCRWDPLLKVQEDAVSGLAAKLRKEIETDAGEGLKSLGRLEAAAGRRAVLKRLEAWAHELLGDAPAQVAAYVEWLGMVEQTHPERPEVVSDLMRLRSRLRLVAAEGALGLTAEDRTWIRRGLGEPAGDPGTSGRELDDVTRSRIRSWQEKRGAKPTGWLTTRGEKDALVTAGREAERRRAELDKLVGLVRAALQAEDAPKAKRYLEELRELDSGFAELGELEASLVELLRPRWEVGEKDRDCDECPLMVVVPAGSYEMGSDSGGSYSHERPVHGVTISEPFAVGVYEVTYAEWDACRRGGGCSHDPDDRGWGRGDRPVMNVSWGDAKEYVRWLSGETGEGYRLLSESEWEYVARSGTRSRYWWGDDIGDNRANCVGCGSRWGGEETSPVGTFSANGYGLHDVHGNVWEWVEDCWHGDYEGAPSDGSAWTTGGNCGSRVLRGGSWYSKPRILRSANRSRLDSGIRDNGVGFRIARTLD